MSRSVLGEQVKEVAPDYRVHVVVVGGSGAETAFQNKALTTLFQTEAITERDVPGKGRTLSLCDYGRRERAV